MLKYLGLSGAKACKSCRSRQELSNEYLLFSIYLQSLASIQPRQKRACSLGNPTLSSSGSAYASFCRGKLRCRKLQKRSGLCPRQAAQSASQVAGAPPSRMNLFSSFTCASGASKGVCGGPVLARLPMSESTLAKTHLSKRNYA